RAEIDGTENVPRDRPFIAVANHNGGPLLPDCWVLAAYWWSLLGVERPAYAMAHDAALGIPLLRTFLVKLGGLRASRENAEKVLRLSSRRRAGWTGMSRWTSVRTMPVTPGLPWGVWLTGFLPNLPLPAKFMYRVGPPIELGHDPDAARDERAVRSACDRVRGIM